MGPLNLLEEIVTENQRKVVLSDDTVPYPQLYATYTVNILWKNYFHPSGRVPGYTVNRFFICLTNVLLNLRLNCIVLTKCFII